MRRLAEFCNEYGLKMRMTVYDDIVYFDFIDMNDKIYSVSYKRNVKYSAENIITDIMRGFKLS